MMKQIILTIYCIIFPRVQVERVTSKMVEDKKEYDLRLQEYAQLLDIRAERIKVIDVTDVFFSYCNVKGNFI